MSTDDKTPALKQASDMLKPHEPKLLDAFAKVFRRKRPPQSMRALAPLAMVFLLEAFGLAFLLDRATVRAAIIAARGPGKGDDEDEPQMSILDATMQDGLLGVFVSDVSLRSEAPPVVECMGQTLNLGACESLDAAAWRAVSKGWIAYLDHRGAVVGLRLIPRTDGVQTRLRAPLANIVSMYAPDKRDERIAQLEADKANLADSNRSMAESVLQLSNKLESIEHQWRYATGVPNPEMARELTAQRIEQIETKTRASAFADNDGDPWIMATGCTTPDAARELLRRVQSQVLDLSGKLLAITAERDGIRNHLDIEHSRLADPAKVESLGKAIDAATDPEDAANWPPTVPHVGRMIWPDPDNAPLPLDCVKTIEAQRRGEFVELAFPSTPKIFEQVRAWLMFYQMNICARTPDATGYCTNAIGLNGEIPPKWSDMKQAKRNSYPGFVLFAPDDSAKVVFCAREPSIGKVGKRKAKEPKS